MCGLILPARKVIKNQRGKSHAGGEKYTTSNGKFLSISFMFKNTLDKTLGFFSIYLFICLFIKVF